MRGQIFGYFSRTFMHKAGSNLKHLYAKPSLGLSTQSIKFKPFQSALRFNRKQPFSDIASTTLAPRVSKPIIGYWYLFSGSLVFGTVVIGGLTRLTESGLSIVEWNLIKGMKPPTTVSEWDQEFSKYKQFPEFIKFVHS